jgi:hypothetical protein
LRNAGQKTIDPYAVSQRTHEINIRLVSSANPNMVPPNQKDERAAAQAIQAFFIRPNLRKDVKR